MGQVRSFLPCCNLVLRKHSYSFQNSEGRFLWWDLPPSGCDDGLALWWTSVSIPRCTSYAYVEMLNCWWFREEGSCQPYDFIQLENRWGEGGRDMQIQAGSHWDCRRGIWTSEEKVTEGMEISKKIRKLLSPAKVPSNFAQIPASWILDVIADLLKMHRACKKKITAWQPTVWLQKITCHSDYLKRGLLAVSPFSGFAHCCWSFGTRKSFGLPCSELHN